MRYVPHISHLGAHIERRSNCRRFLACPTCGTTGQRVSAVERTVAHIALGRPTQMQARVGVY
jgi:4-hydroxy-3-methylbut-2-en-1-yl diphosphate synthase IspG/GcpE